jgi:hypothetical protein
VSGLPVMRAAKGSLLVLGVLAVIAATFGVRTFMAAEARVETYCGEIAIGENVEAASQRARESGLAVRALSAGSFKIRIESDGAERFEEGQSGPFLSVGDPLALSFCSLDHDGHRITGKSYNPWTE